MNNGLHWGQERRIRKRESCGVRENDREMSRHVGNQCMISARSTLHGRKNKKIWHCEGGLARTIPTLRLRSTTIIGGKRKGGDIETKDDGYNGVGREKERKGGLKKKPTNYLGVFLSNLFILSHQLTSLWYILL